MAEMDMRIAEWKKLHEEVLAVEEDYENEDFRSLCVGWCLAKGMTTDEAYSFYSARCRDGSNS